MSEDLEAFLHDMDMREWQRWAVFNYRAGLKVYNAAFRELIERRVAALAWLKPRLPVLPTWKQELQAVKSARRR